MNKMIRLVACTYVLSASAFAAAEFQTELSKAKETAAAEKKLMFILYGRQACGNCQATRAMIKSRNIRVPASKYVLVDLNCDDPAVSKTFNDSYGKQQFGTTLPFVVIADSQGNALGTSGGYKDAQAWSQVIKAAEKKASPASSGKAGDPNWPFKTPPSATR